MSDYHIGGKSYSYDDLTGKWFASESGAFVRNQAIIKQLEDATGKIHHIGKKRTASKSSTARRQSLARLQKNYGSFFQSKTGLFSDKGGHIRSWAKPLTLRGGKDPIYNWGRTPYRGANGKIVSGSSSTRWGSNINSNGPATVLVGTKQWIRQLQIAQHALYVSAEHFRIVVGQRAIKVFQNSFKYQQFYSSRAQRWKPLSAWTLKKRAWRGTGSRILKEYGDLHDSIKIKENVNLKTTQVYTDIVPANNSHHKRYSICYAGYHNEGCGTYGNGWNGHKPKAYIRRQFMGHSSHLDPYKDPFMKKMMKMYLFDSVFLVKKV